jgi:hypothetical protein
MKSHSVPEALLIHGSAVLDSVLVPHGFAFRIVKVGTGSGGDFAVGCYEAPERSIELHVRQVLGIVIFHKGNMKLDHRDVVSCLGLDPEEVAYPGFPKSPIESFEHLRRDLVAPLAGFLDGSIDSRLAECAGVLKVDPDAFKPGLP